MMRKKKYIDWAKENPDLVDDAGWRITKYGVSRKRFPIQKGEGRGRFTRKRRTNLPKG